MLLTITTLLPRVYLALAADPRAGLKDQAGAEHFTLKGSEMEDPTLNLILSQSAYGLSNLPIPVTSGNISTNLPLV